jgi:hypothetical protein
MEAIVKQVVTVIEIREQDVALCQRILGAMKADDIIRAYVWREDYAVLIPAYGMEPVEVKIAFDQLKKRMEADNSE